MIEPDPTAEVPTTTDQANELGDARSDPGGVARVIEEAEALAMRIDDYLSSFDDRISTEQDLRLATHLLASTPRYLRTLLAALREAEQRAGRYERALGWVETAATLNTAHLIAERALWNSTPEDPGGDEK